MLNNPMYCFSLFFGRPLLPFGTATMYLHHPAAPSVSLNLNNAISGGKSLFYATAFDAPTAILFPFILTAITFSLGGTNNAPHPRRRPHQYGISIPACIT